MTRPSGGSPSCTPRRSSSSAATRPRSGSAACTHWNGSPRTTLHTARPSSTSSAPTCACRSPPRRRPASRSPRPPKTRESLPLRLKRGLMGLATHGSRKDRCVLPRSVFLPSICVTTGPTISAPPILRARVSGLSIRLDLTGATLIDFDLVSGVVADARFSRATFSGDAMVRRGDLHRPRHVRRGDLQRRRPVRPGDLQRRRRVRRGDLHRRRLVRRGDLQQRSPRFGGATFTGDALFDGATFSGDARFDGATFSGDAAVRQGDLQRQRPCFSRATFTRRRPVRAGRPSPASPGSSGRPSAASRFDEATFSGDAMFDEATFSGGEGSLSFKQSRVLSPDAQHVWPTGWCLGPDGSGGYTVVRANG